MQRLIALLVGLLIAVTLAPSGEASAGGWAVTTLDTLPEMSPGTTVDVGFTVRQHGVTPVDLSTFSKDPVGVTLIGSDGARKHFPATARGPLGHYVAPVTVPAAGAYRWEVLQGPFAAQPLGALDIAAPAKTSAAQPASVGNGDGFESLVAIRWAAVGVAAALGAISAANLLRRRTAPASHGPA